MAESKVKLPTGDIVTIRHPEGASQEQIFRFARMQMDQPSSEPSLAELNPAEFDPSSEEFQAQYGPTSGPAMDNFLAGAGKFFVDRMRGAQQLFGADNQREIDLAQERDQALLGTKAGLAGNIAGGIAATAPVALIPGVNTLAGATAAGAGLGFTDPVATGQSRVVNTALGGAGGAAGYGLGRIIGGAGSQLNRTQRAIAERGRELGFRTTPGEASGIPALRRLEAALESRSFTSGPLDRIKGGNQTIANRLFNEAIGETGDEVDDVVLDSAFRRLGRVFDKARNIDDQVIDGVDAGRFLNTLQDDLRGVTKDNILRNPLVEEYTSLAARGNASGRQLRSLSSRLGKRINNEMTTPSGDRELGKGLGQLKDRIDDLIERGMSPAQLDEYQLARRQYRLLINALSRQNIINESTGNVNLRGLANVLRKSDRSGFLRGQNQGDIYNAARFGKAFAPIVGDSGTATRSQGATDFITGLPFGMLSRAYFSPVTEAIARGAGRAGQGAQAVLGPASDPALLGLLGANIATASN